MNTSTVTLVQSTVLTTLDPDAVEDRVNITVHVFNGDRGIQLANIDGALRGPSGAVTGPLAKKAQGVATRAIHLVGTTDAVVLYRRPTEEFLAYIEALYGGVPTVISPQEIDDSITLDLIADICRCDVAMADLRRFIADHSGAMLDPFIGDPSIFVLASDLGVGVRGISKDDVYGGLVAELNDKATFQCVCIGLGIRIPKSIHVQGWEKIKRTARDVYDETGDVVLRRTRSAGGLGNIFVTEDDLDRSPLAEYGISMNGEMVIVDRQTFLQSGQDSVFVIRPTLEAHLDHLAYPTDAWDSEIVFVEPMLKIVSSPSTLCFVACDGTIGPVTSSDQVVKHGSFYGCIYPSAEPSELMRQLEQWTYQYAQHFAAEGGRGWFNIDWGVLDDGSVIAFESNARYTGSVHPMIIAKRLRGDGTIGHVQSNDAVQIPLTMTFLDVISQISDLLWNSTRRSGVVISIPPTGGEEKQTIGVVVLANSQAELAEIYDALIERVAVK